MKSVMAEVKEEKKEVKKLSYEQLEAYASQIVEKAKELYAENQRLKEVLYNQNLKEVELAIKCLDHADMFSIEFINAVVERVETIMNPRPVEEEREEDTPKENGAEVVELKKEEE